MIKLYDLEKGSKIRVAVKDELGNKYNTITFDHIDGLYSYCTIDNYKGNQNNVVHLYIGTILKKRKDYYIITTI